MAGDKMLAKEGLIWIVFLICVSLVIRGLLLENSV